MTTATMEAAMTTTRKIKMARKTTLFLRRLPKMETATIQVAPLVPDKRLSRFYNLNFFSI